MPVVESLTPELRSNTEGVTGQGDRTPQSSRQVVEEEIPVLPLNASAEAVFKSGTRLIRDNSGESIGTSKAQLEAGIARVQDALRAGIQRKADAYAALYHGYYALRTRTDVTKEEDARLAVLQGEAAKRAWDLDPGNVELGMNYVQGLSNARERTGALQAMVSRSPQSADARALLGTQVCLEGDKAEARKQFVAAAERLSIDELKGRGPDLIQRASECDKAVRDEVERVLSRRAR